MRNTITQPTTVWVIGIIWFQLPHEILQLPLWKPVTTEGTCVAKILHWDELEVYYIFSLQQFFLKHFVCLIFSSLLSAFIPLKYICIFFHFLWEGILTYERGLLTFGTRVSLRKTICDHPHFLHILDSFTWQGGSGEWLPRNIFHPFSRIWNGPNMKPLLSMPSCSSYVNCSK